MCAGQLANQAGWKHNWSVPWHNSQRRDQEAVHGGGRDRGAVAGGQAGGRWLEGGAQLQVPPRPSAEGDTDYQSYFFPLKTQASLLMCYLFFQIGLIRLKLWEGAQLIADSGNIIGYNLNKDRIWQKKNRISILVYFQR